MNKKSFYQYISLVRNLTVLQCGIILQFLAFILRQIYTNDLSKHMPRKEICSIRVTRSIEDDEAANLK